MSGTEGVGMRRPTPAAGRDSGTGMPPACVPDEGESCSICGDEGQVGEVLEIAAGESTARLRLPGGERHVAIELVEDVKAGDRLVVHLGVAIARVREAPVPGGGPGRRLRDGSATARRGPGP